MHPQGGETPVSGFADKRRPPSGRGYARPAPPDNDAFVACPRTRRRVRQSWDGHSNSKGISWLVAPSHSWRLAQTSTATVNPRYVFVCPPCPVGGISTSGAGGRAAAAMCVVPGQTVGTLPSTGKSGSLASTVISTTCSNNGAVAAPIYFSRRRLAPAPATICRENNLLHRKAHTGRRSSHQ